MARNYSSVVEPKALTANITDTAATQITLNNVTGLPAKPYVLVINPDTDKEEVVLVTVDQTGVTSPTLKVTRAIEANGAGAGVAKTHSVGDTVKHMIVGSDLQIVHDHFSATTGVHGLGVGVSPAPLASPTFTGTVVLPSTTSIGTVNSTEISYVDGVTSAIQTQLNTNTPVGTIIMYGGTTAPTGWLLCNGQSTASYAALAAVVGANVPDLRGRAPVGYGDSDDAGITTRSTIGAKFGAESVTLSVSEMPSHNHPLDVGDGQGSLAKTSWMDRNTSHGHTLVNAGEHQHQINTAIEIAGSLANDTQINWLINGKTTGANYLVTNGGEGGHDHGGVNGQDTNHRHDLAAQGGGAAHNNLQPSTVVNFIIKH
jgi:microcystin-dependent protein